MNNSILKNHPAADSFPMMDDDRYSDLLEDIRQHGQKESIALYDGMVLDGRNRYRACLELEVEPLTRKIDIQPEDTPWDYVWSLNGQRRDLTIEQRYLCWKHCEEGKGEWQAEQARIQEEGNRKRSAATQTQHEVSTPRHGETLVVGHCAQLPKKKAGSPTRKAKAGKSRTSEAAVARGDKLAKERPDLAEQVRLGKMPARKAREQAKQDDRKAQRSKAAKGAPPLDQRILIGDFRVRGVEIPDGSVSLIFTDPPYDRKASKMLPELAKFAADKLADGGSMLCYVGQTQLPAALDAFRGNLRYWWTIACVHAGKSTVMHEYGINAGWKAVLWFVKGTRDDTSVMVRDVMSGGEEKADHEWQQAESEAAYWIEKLCPVDGLVCDPFLGSGTTAAAAKSLARQWVGIEIDEDTAKAAGVRLQ